MMEKFEMYIKHLVQRLAFIFIFIIIILIFIYLAAPAL